MKRTFTRLISVPLPGSTDEDEEEEKAREEDTYEHKERDPLLNRGCERDRRRQSA